MAKSKDDLMNDENEVKSSYVKWGKVGDFIMGALKEKTIVDNVSPEGKKSKQTVYFIKVYSCEYHDGDTKVVLPEGDETRVYGRIGIDAQMRNMKIGQILAMKFKEEKPNTDKMKNPTKVIKVYTKGDMDEEIEASMQNLEQPADLDEF